MMMQRARALARALPAGQRLAKRMFGFRPLADRPHGERGVRQLGHRQYVGGKWDQLGKLQFDFLIAQGLEPGHYLLDVGCGSLRAGVRFIQYLDPGHYLGIDKEPLLIDAGIRTELGLSLFEARQPQLLVSAAFEVERFGIPPDFVLAQSIFTHLPRTMIGNCLRKVRMVIRGEGAFFATFFESRFRRDNPAQAHDHDSFFYTRSEMEDLGRRHGWRMHYIGNWGHPRNQRMVKYTPSG